MDSLAGSPAPAALSGWPFASAAFDSSDLPAEGPADLAEVVPAADIVVAVDVDAVAEIVAAVDVDAFASDVAVVANVSAVLDAVVDANFSAAANVVAADVAALCYDLLLWNNHDSLRKILRKK